MSREAAVRELYEQTVALTDGQRSTLLKSSDFDPVVATRAQQLLTAATVLSSDPAAPPPKPPETPPSKVGRYEIRGVLGQGGFGIVYSGRDTVLKRRVAIKMCLSDDEELRRRFVHEAEISAGLQHPNVVTIYDFGVEEGLPYLVQELLTGEDMSETIRDRSPSDLDLNVRLQALLGVAEGLAHAHRHGVVHRDIKPSNVRLTDTGGIKLLDFGIAQLLHRHSNLSVDDGVAGTVGYLAPELLNGESVGKSSDVFSFGALAFEWLTGKRAFPGVSFAEVAYGLLFHPVELDELRRLGVPEGMVEVVERCLKKDAADRYEDAADLASDLRDLPLLGVSDSNPMSEVVVDPEIQKETQAERADPETPENVFRKAGRSQWIAGLLLALGIVFGLWRGLEEPDPAEDGSASAVRSPQGMQAAESGPLESGPMESGPMESGPMEPGATEAGSLESQPGEPRQSTPADLSSGHALGSEIADEEGAPIEASPPVSDDSESSAAFDSPPVDPRLEQERRAQTAQETTAQESRAITEPESEGVENSEGQGSGEQRSSVESPEPEPASLAEVAPTLEEEPETVEPSRAFASSADENAADEDAAVPSQASPSEATAPPQEAERVGNQVEAPPLYAENQAGVIPPKPMDAPNAEYPRRARRRQISTQVVVGVLVNTEGRVVRILPVRKDRSELGFNEAAEAAARATRFEPATLDGVPGEMWTQLIYNFKP